MFPISTLMSHGMPPYFSLLASSCVQIYNNLTELLKNYKIVINQGSIPCLSQRLYFDFNGMILGIILELLGAISRLLAGHWQNNLKKSYRLSNCMRMEQTGNAPINQLSF